MLFHTKKAVRKPTMLASCLALIGGAQPVWVKPGATSTDFQVAKGRCLSSAYSQVPAAPSMAVISQGYQSPVVTNCSAFGSSASCITSGGQHTPPVSVPFDANAGVRNEIFQGCMVGEGWTLEWAGDVPAVTADTDWSKGLKWGVKKGPTAACEMPPKDVLKPDDWTLGCRSGRKSHDSET